LPPNLIPEVNARCADLLRELDGKQRNKWLQPEYAFSKQISELRNTRRCHTVSIQGRIGVKHIKELNDA